MKLQEFRISWKNRVGVMNRTQVLSLLAVRCPGPLHYLAPFDYFVYRAQRWLIKLHFLILVSLSEILITNFNYNRFPNVVMSLETMNNMDIDCNEQYQRWRLYSFENVLWLFLFTRNYCYLINIRINYHWVFKSFFMFRKFLQRAFLILSSLKRNKCKLP